MGVWADGQVIEVAAGVLSKATGVEATVDTVFQVGSITKVWTTTLVMQLVDEGLVDLDAAGAAYLPEFAVGDETAAASITVRQLLCHIAGFEGDVFTDTGQGEDCVEKYVATIRETTQLFPPGEMFSYNNAGFWCSGASSRCCAASRSTGACASTCRPARPDPRRPARTRRSCTVPPSAISSEPTATRGRAGLGAAPLQRAGRLDAGHAPARPARLRPCTSTAARRRRHSGTQLRRASPRCRSRRSRCRSSP